MSASTSSLLNEADQYLVSETTHIVNSEDNKYIDILVYLKSSSDRRYSPELNSLTLYYTISSSTNSKSFTTALQFSKALEKNNISILTNPDRIELTSSELVNAMFLLEGNSIKVIDEDKNIVASLSLDGSTLYESPRQVFAKAGLGFRNPKCLDILDNGFLIADTQNDRILEIDFSGNLTYAVQGNVYLSKSARDFVALTSNYNERLGIIYIAFSQNINSTFDRSKFTLTTSDRSNSFTFLTDDDGIFTTVPDSNGKSAVLKITLGTARKQQVDNWNSSKIILIAQGGVTGSAGSTTTTTETVSTASITIQAETSQIPTQVITQSADGTILVENPTDNTVVVAETQDELNTFDFNADGTINSQDLMDIDGETSVVTIIVEDADIIYSNLQYPLSAEKSGDNNYIVAQDNDISVYNIGIDTESVWNIYKTVVSFDWLKGGNAQLLDDGSVLCASPTMKKVMQIMPSSNSILFSYTPNFTPVFANRLSSGNTIIIENDETYSSLNSRVIEIDINKDIVKEWGLGRLNNPTGVYVLANNNWLISC